MPTKFFSIVVVSLNSGQRLKKTLQSILAQTFTEYEIIIKDGGSCDGSIDFLEAEAYFQTYPQICLIQKEDRSIYDGMNQALEYVHGQYVQFLNCGDLFYDENVLEETAKWIQEDVPWQEEKTPVIYYGNQYNLLQKTVVTSAPKITDFTCYRNVPCHQVCFYDYRLFQKRAYVTEYTVRADYEHFLYCVYQKKARTKAIPVIICKYEGGGYSETKENRKKSAKQHARITRKYLGKKALWYRLLMLLTCAGVRTKIAENPVLSKPYNAIKSYLYK